MNRKGNEFTAVTVSLPHIPAYWTVAEHPTLYTGDIRHPWKSAHGFPMAAAYLAGGQELVLSCREDEVFELLAKLNTLLQSPRSLHQAYNFLKQLQETTIQKLARSIQLERQSLADGEVSDLVEEIEQLLAQPSAPTVVDRLETILSLNNPTSEMVGVGKMLVRLHRFQAALEAVKNRGFQVGVSERRRQPARPALEARRHEPVGANSAAKALPAGFLLPAQNHMTLWNYLITRREAAGQGAIWN